MSPEQVAALKKVNVESVRRILREDARRQAIFPGAISIGEGKSKRWDIPEDQAVAWQPVYSKQRR